MTKCGTVKGSFSGLIKNEFIKFYSGRMMFIVILLLVMTVLVQAFSLEAAIEEVPENATEAINNELENINDILGGDYGMSDMTLKHYQSQLKIFEYMRDNNISPVKTHSIGNLIATINQMFAIVVIIFIVGAGKIMSDEYSNQTLPSLVSKPCSRIKIIIAKFITMISLCIVVEVIVIALSTIIGGFFWGFSDIGQKIVSYEDGIVVRSLIGQALHYATYNFFTLLACGTITLALTIIMKNGILGVGASSMLYFLSSSMIMSLAKYDGLRYTLFANIQYQIYFDGIEIFKGLTANESVLNVVIHVIVIMILTTCWFNRINADE